jgi:acetate---CoA ligase (ADP-forming) subunit beta
MPTLSEHESKRLLADFGLPLGAERLVATPEAAVAAAEELGYPVAAKLCGDHVAHKTERGLVRLGLRDGDALRAASAELLAAARPEDAATGVLVAPMVAGLRELIAGLHEDPQFGPCVMLGVGGVFAEALADVAFRLVPVSAVDAEEMLDELHHQALLGAFRGEPPVDRDALVAVARGLSALAEARPDVESVDLNPLVVLGAGPDAGRPVAVDALVVLRDGS